MPAVMVILALLGVMVVPAGAGRCTGAAGPAARDFNGDGHADAAVGDPFMTVDGARAGGVTIRYGDADGAGGGRRALVTQNSTGVPGRAGDDDRFGLSLAAADLDGDGCTDLVVGSPGERVAGAREAGAVVVLYGSPEGIGGRARWIDQRTAGVPGTPEPGDQFGHSLSAAPARGRDDAVVVAGVPYEDLGSTGDAGGLTALRFTRTGDLAVARWFDQDTPGVPGVPEQGDLFGSDPEVARISGSAGRWDLVVGTPYEDIGTRQDAGSLTAIEDFAEAVSEHRALAWTQASRDVAGTVEAGDLFGTDPEQVVTPEGAYLAAGVPGEDLRGADDGGMVQVFRGLNPQRAFHQDLPGAAGGVEEGDFFGGVLHGVTRPVSGGHARIVVGLPYEDLGGHADACAAQSFSLDAPGVEDRWLSQDALPGSLGDGDRFGLALGGTGDALLVGVPYEDGRGLVHVLPFGDGGGRTWEPGEGAERFGLAIA